MPTPSIKETISAHDEGEGLPRMGGEDIQKLIASAPDHIWLDLGEEAHLITEGDTFKDLGGVTWSEDNATGCGIKYVRAATSAAPQSDGWISVDERLPAHEQEVICTGFEGDDPTKKRWQEFAVFHSDGTFYDREIGDELYPPTHWRETFALPTTQTQGQSHGK